MSDEHHSYVYFFGAGQADGGSAIKHLVGGKGASLADMTRAGLNVPPGFTISAECCDLYFRFGKKWPAGLEEEVRGNLARLEQLAGRRFGQGDDPLLVAVRSGAAHSMPGMMDTVLNVGLNPTCVRALADRTGNRRAAWEAYRHFLVMFGHTVGGVEEAVFTALIAEMLQESGKQLEEELTGEQMETLSGRCLSAYRHHAGSALPTQPWDMLCAAIDAVFGSWNNDRAVAYRKHHQIDGLLGTAVTVQMMCPSEVSGILFTANPVAPGLEQIIIESSFGLGEAIVLGKVTPDRFVFDKGSQRVIERTLSVKRQVTKTIVRDGAEQRGAQDASLNDAQVAELARLGLRVEAYFQFPCDLEWALSEGQFYLLQARPIKGLERVGRMDNPSSMLEKVDRIDNPSCTIDSAEREQVRREEIAILAARAEPGGTVWSRYNLSEVLPEPTPMTWAIVRRMMSVHGGFGLMYLDLGFDPDPALGDDGVFDLICGRPYYNLSREPRMQYRALPFEHPFAVLKAAPSRAIYPRPVFNAARAGWRFWVMLPVIVAKMTRSALKLNRLSRTFAQEFRATIVPSFLKEVEEAEAQDVTALSSEVILERLETWIRRTLVDFARDSLKPTALAAVAMGNLEQSLAKNLGPERAQAALEELIMGVHPDAEADLPGAVRELTRGSLDRETFLKRFGHRGSQEMELAHARWAEDPAALDRLMHEAVAHAGARSAEHEGESDGQKPGCLKKPGFWDDRESARVPFARKWEEIAGEAKLPDVQRSALRTELDTLHAYLGLRETAKHYLMRGYALMRRFLVELDRRHRLEGGIFFLTPEELPRLTAGADLLAVIDERRRRRMLALSLEVPQVIFSDDLEALGRSASYTSEDSMKGTPLSAGVAEGEVLVLLDPARAELPDKPYILVCPSTDPAWMPLFVNARALVMETGGMLSHGAIVARELNLPAVAGLPDIHRRLRTGQRVRVDGGGGTVTLLR